MNRKHFLLPSVAASVPILVAPLHVLAKNSEDPEPYKVDIVNEFVIAGHGK